MPATESASELADGRSSGSTATVDLSDTWDSRASRARARRPDAEPADLRARSPGTASDGGVTPMTTALPLRSVHAAADGADRLRPLLQRGSRPRGRLRDRHPPGQPRARGRIGLPAPVLPARPRRGRQPLRRGPRPVGVPPAVARADARDHRGHAGQRDADPDGLRQRPRPAPDAALLHPAARRHRALQPQLPDLLRGIRHERGPIRPPAAHPAHARRLDRARGRQDRRAHAVRRRADGAPRDRRDHPRPPSSARSPACCSTRTASGSRATTGSSPRSHGCATGSRSTSSSTASSSRRTSTTAARTCAR